MPLVPNWFMSIQIALNIKFWLVSYPHFLKISFKLTKCGLGYSLKRDQRPFSECTQVWTILALTVSKNGFWRLQLIDWTFILGQFHLSINIEFPGNQWRLQNAFLEAVNDKMVQTCVNSENGLGSRFRL